MANLKITDLWIYPIKSIAGIQLSTANVEPRGLQYDRRWVLADMEGVFVHQRDYPVMTLLQPEINGANMTISHKQGIYEPLTFDMAEPDTEPVQVQVWDDICRAKPVSPAANEWFSIALEKPVQLLYMHEASIRPADSRYAINPHDKVSFADGYPVLMISEESLELLNDKTEEHVPMNRFRANIIFSGGTAHVEDTLRKVDINGVELFGVKPCARCVMTTIDVETAKKGKEPLKTLATYRKLGNKILFGENFIPGNIGTIAVGDHITANEFKEPPFA